MAKGIEINLFSSKSIEKAIKELEEYKASLNDKAIKLTRTIAEKLEERILARFNSSLINDKEPIKVDVNIEGNGNHIMIIASGEDAIWVEFGAGVYYNGKAGSSPHPKGKEFGYTIGDYGYGRGKQKAWGYRDENGNLHITHGTKATMPMYMSVQEICDEIESIAREVFSNT